MASENRLITAIDAERPAHPETQYDTGYNNGLTMAIAIAVRLNARDVVMCQDCRRFKCADDGIFYCYRDKLGPGVFMRKTDFCSYGERRTDNEVHSSDPCHL